MKMCYFHTAKKRKKKKKENSGNSDSTWSLVGHYLLLNNKNRQFGELAWQKI